MAHREFSRAGRFRPTGTLCVCQSLAQDTCGASSSEWDRDITRTMSRMALIDQIQQARELSKNLLTLLQLESLECDRFVSHLYQSRKEYRRTCETAGKSGKQIER